MSYGIYDADMQKYLLVPFNLTAMKLSAYYKNKYEIVTLAKNFTPERNKNFVYVKDWDDGDYPPNLIQSNVEYYGHAFSGSQYIALPEEIEIMKPDTELYLPMEEIINDGSAKRKRIFQNMLQAEHCRLSLDGERLWSNYSKQFKNLATCKNIMFHDWDLNKIDGAWPAVQEILSHTKRKPLIGMKFPIQLDNHVDLMKWSSLNVNPIFFSVRYNGIMTNEEFYDWAQAGFSRKAYAYIEYNITPNNLTETDFIHKYLCNIFKQVIISRSYRLKMTLIYDKDFFSNPKWIQVIDLFNYYQHSMLNSFSDDAFLREVQNDTLYDFVKKSFTTYAKYPKMLTKSEMREVFHFVGDVLPDLFKDFYELTIIKIKNEGGFK